MLINYTDGKEDGSVQSKGLFPQTKKREEVLEGTDRSSKDFRGKFTKAIQRNRDALGIIQLRY